MDDDIAGEIEIVFNKAVVPAVVVVIPPPLLVVFVFVDVLVTDKPFAAMGILLSIMRRDDDNVVKIMTTIII